MTDEKKTLEQKFFTWEGWDHAGTVALQFYDCKMVADFGPLRVGESYDIIFLDYSYGRCDVYKDGDDEHSITFQFTIMEVK